MTTEPGAPDRRITGDATRNAILFLAVVAGGVVVMALHSILTPLVVALFVLILIDAFARGIERRWPACPDWLSLSAAVASGVAGLAIVAGLFAHYVRPFTVEVVSLEPKIDAMLGSLTGAMHMPSLTLPELTRGENPSTALLAMLEAARSVVSRTALVMIYLGFLLASRRAFEQKMQRLFPNPIRHAHALAVFHRVRVATEEYMTIQTLKALLVAFAGVCVTLVLGVPNAPFWALLLFMISYIPIVGGVAGAVAPALVALAQFDSPARPLALFGLLGGSIFLIDNVLMPKIQADRLNIDPVVVLLSLGFWGALLGLPGVFLSTPLTVVAIALTAQFNHLRWIAVLLSKDGVALSDRPADLEPGAGPGIA